MDNKNHLPFYLRTWFITLLYLTYPFTYFITAIIATLLLVYRYQKRPTLSQEDFIKWKEYESAKIDAATIAVAEQYFESLKIEQNS